MKCMDDFKALVHNRNHTIIAGKHESNSSWLTLHCTKHNHTQCVVIHLYKANRTVLICCTADKISKNVIESNIRRGTKPKLTPD